jgi:hypothetical protein
MPSRPVGVADADVTGATFVDVDTVERPSPDLTTTTTADPGSGGTTLAVTSAAKFPTVNGYKIKVESEIMRVTAGAGTASWTVTRGLDNTTAVAHTTGVSVSLVVAVQRVSPITERVISCQAMATSFRAPGRASVSQNIFSIFNKSGSNILIAVRRLTVQMDATVVLTAVVPSFKTSRITAVPTNGTALSPVVFDSLQSSSANLDLRGDASADGTSSATTLTSTPGTAAWTQLQMRLHTAVGQVLTDDMTVIPSVCDTDPITLRASEGLLVTVIAAATTSNPATNFYVTNCMWEEYTTP